MTAFRIIPTNSRKVEDNLTGSCVYLYERNGRPCVQAFVGKRSKPVFSFYYRTEAERDARASSFLKGQRATAEAKLARRAEEKAAQRTTEVGHVFTSSWGYEQTNVDFYVVTSLVGKTMVEVRKCGAIRTIDNGDRGEVIPNAEKLIGEPIRCKVNARGGIKVDGHHARIWDGKPEYFSTYA